MTKRLPPRLVVRTSFVTLSTAAVLLSAVFMVVTLDVRDRVRANVTEKLEAGQRMLSALEHRRGDDLTLQVAMLAENPTLKAALDIYQSEPTSAKAASQPEMLATVSRELDKIADRLHPDILAGSDAAGRTIAVTGRLAQEWARADGPGSRGRGGPGLRADAFRVASADVVLQDTTIGTLQLGTALDDQYARELSALSGAATLIATPDRVLATTLPEKTAARITRDLLGSVSGARVVTIGDAEYAVRELIDGGTDRGAGVYVLDSIDASAAPALRKAVQTILMIALGAFAFASLASVWLARTVARPIDTLSRSVSGMTRAKTFDEPVPPSGFSREIDSLTAAFNDMMVAVLTAEAETRAAYVGTIRALAMTLDARDQYTAGHSERVSALSVAVGRQLQLDDEDLEVLRLGALLHDIGKVGVPDDVLRKPGRLTASEFEAIKQHPTLGARILRSVPFLAPHIPIVELHHERPDGTGYPHGLRGDEIPPLARIVHVTDAFDAMTSARAYRPGRSSAEAFQELWRCAGSEFDTEIVQALAAALPVADAGPASGSRPVLATTRRPRLASAPASSGS